MLAAGASGVRDGGGVSGVGVVFWSCKECFFAEFFLPEAMQSNSNSLLSIKKDVVHFLTRVPF